MSEYTAFVPLVEYELEVELRLGLIAVSAAKAVMPAHERSIADETTAASAFLSIILSPPY